MKKDEYIKYWLKSAAHDLKAAEDMFKNKHYDWCLYMGHLVLEKVLKAFFVRDNKVNIPPKIHNLIILADKTKLKLDKERKEFLFIVDKFNIAVRYPDYKFNFYKNCTKKYTTEKFEKIKEIYKWLIKKIR